MLAGAYSRLEGRLDRIGDLFEGQYRTASRKGYRRITRYHLLEGATSQAWQAWCGFCRHVVHASCSGTTTMTGVVVPPIANAPSLGRMAYVSKQLMVGQAVKPGKECRPHQEPTWGDPKVCLEAIDYFKPTNSVSLKVGLSLAYPAPEHLRTVRNATAHFSENGIKEVKTISIFYQGAGFSHPLDLLCWEVKGTGETAFLVWLDDLKTMAFEMCQ